VNALSRGDAPAQGEAWFSPSGRLIVIRSIRPGDLALLDALARQLSARSRCQRFQLEPWQPIPPQVDRLVRFDGRHEVALVAVAPAASGPVAVGEARYTRTAGPAGEREFALVVADSMQWQGLGTTLLRRLIGHAGRAGIERLYGDVRADNQPMLRLAAKLGLERKRSRSDGRHLRVQMAFKYARAMPVGAADAALAGT
jgi:RimJ/RimL family protein N-acetyltransferase